MVSVTIATEALRDESILDANLERVAVERARLTAGLRAAGWSVGPSVTNFVLVGPGLGGPRRDDCRGTAPARGLVPRTFGRDHPLAGHLRLTVRDPHENDRLIEAAQAIAKEGPA